MSDDSSPQVIASTKVPSQPLWQVESNCACSSPDRLDLMNPIHISPCDKRIFGLPALYTAPVNTRFSLAFNPLGHSGVMVLNRSGFALLNSFAHPRTLEHEVAAVGNPTNGLHAAQQLAQLGLLQPVDAPPAPLAANSLLTAWIHTTNACNLRCSYCYVNKSDEGMSPETGRRAIDAVFRSAIANHLTHIKLKYAGGEPTLNFKLVLLLHDYAQARALAFSIELEGVLLSNGIGLTRSMIRQLQDRHIRVMISLDGVGPYHDTQRPLKVGGGSFVYVERSLDRLTELNHRPSISITVTPQNLAGLPQVVEYILQRDLPFNLNFCRSEACFGRGQQRFQGEEKVIASIKAALDTVAMYLPQYPVAGSLLDLVRIGPGQDRACGAGDSYLVIDQRGVISKCHMELGRTVTDVSAADPLATLRADCAGWQNSTVDSREGCRDCVWRYQCGGGCPIMTAKVTGRLDIKSPYCEIYKALIPELLRLEARRLLKYTVRNGN